MVLSKRRNGRSRRDVSRVSQSRSQPYAAWRPAGTNAGCRGRRGGGAGEGARRVAARIQRRTLPRTTPAGPRARAQRSRSVVARGPDRPRFAHVISEEITMIRRALHIAAVALAALVVVITFAGTRSTT